MRARAGRRDRSFATWKPNCRAPNYALQNELPGSLVSFPMTNCSLQQCADPLSLLIPPWPAVKLLPRRLRTHVWGLFSPKTPSPAAGRLFRAGEKYREQVRVARSLSSTKSSISFRGGAISSSTNVSYARYLPSDWKMARPPSKPSKKSIYTCKCICVCVCIYPLYRNVSVTCVNAVLLDYCKLDICESNNK